MGKQGAQGREWETEVTRHAAQRGRFAEVLSKSGIKGEPDVRVLGSGRYMPLVFWKNWIKKPGQRRRSVKIVSMLESDFWDLVDKDDQENYGFLIQCKSTQALSVRATLEQLIETIKTGRWDI